MKHIFDSELFKDFSTKLMTRINETDDTKNTRVENVLNGVLHTLN